MRISLIASAAAIATALGSPVAAQNHDGHGDHQAQSEGLNEDQNGAQATADHCAMGHLPPDQCPPDRADAAHEGMDHSGHGAHQTNAEGDHRDMDHGAMDHGAMDHGTMDHGAMDHGNMDHGQHAAGLDKSAPGAAPEDAVPARAFDGPRHAADAIWGAEAMAASRADLAHNAGGMRTGSVLIERLEARFAADGGEDGYVWDAQGFYGGDINRFVIKTEGEGGFGAELESAEIQALYSRAIGPFFDLQAGVRFDPRPDTRGHLVVGVQGLAPYMFHVDGALFLSDRGDLTARLEGEYDQRITQRLIVQPRVEVELAVQDIPERAIGAGITKIEPGLRLRYEIEREFAPYIGIEYEAALGQTANIARAAGEDPDGFKLLVGLRTWF